MNLLLIKEIIIQCINPIVFKYFDKQFHHYLSEISVKVPVNLVYH